MKTYLTTTNKRARAYIEYLQEQLKNASIRHSTARTSEAAVRIWKEKQDIIKQLDAAYEFENKRGTLIKIKK